ncbi:MAG: 16S rRNA (adenine(1518)-N(6)/adenine(1519)-N(6))-dimethyltransferase RsmA [Alphaproteobacteria bacterium]|nr:MAG: 16S rRNA (adenine(1518)-N(6)/adenine(1519)-N(6))-dimethyltransferase RsmA [Alphaproteobacteria bacterium]
MSTASRTPLTPGAAKKSLGQHFLFDPALLRRVATAGGPVEGKTVIEVGPGPGGLTRALLESGVAKLIAIELDDRFAQGLMAWPEARTGQLNVHHGDARTANPPELVKAAGGELPAMIIANLPYNVGTPLLVEWLKEGAWRGTMVLMFQKEVGLRICAQPDEDHYGRLAVLAQAATRPRMAMIIPPGAFRPPPKVDSAVVVLDPLPANEIFADLSGLETMTAAAFGQRRKMLRAALKSLPGAVEALTIANIDPTRRAETLTQSEFRALTNAWRNNR